MHNPGAQQALARQTYQLPPNSLLGVISATRPIPGGQSITHYKGAMAFPANNAGAVGYKEWRRLVKDQVVARNFTPLANFAIGECQQIVAGMRRLRPACDQLATESAANNVARMREANEAIVQLVKDSRSKLTTTMNKQLQVVAKGQPAPALGQPGVPTTQVIVPSLVLPLGTPIQWGLAMADPNPAPVPQNALPAINPRQAQGQVIPGAVLAQAQVVARVVPGQPQPQAQGQVVPIVPAPRQVTPGVVPGQPQPQAEGQVVPVVPAPGQVAPGVVPGQPQPQVQGQVVPTLPAPGQVAPGDVPGQPQPQGQGQVVPVVPAPGQVAPGVVPGQPQPRAQAQVVPIVPAPGEVGPGVVPGQPQPQAQGQVVPVVPAQAPLPPGVAPGQPQPPINQPQAQTQVAQAAHTMQGQGIPAPQNTPPVAGSP